MFIWVEGVSASLEELRVFKSKLQSKANSRKLQETFSRCYCSQIFRVGGFFIFEDYVIIFVSRV